jgi:CheY-like chemotaxis protein
VADLQVGHPGVNLTRLPALPHRGHTLAGDALREKPGGEMQTKVGDNSLALLLRMSGHDVQVAQDGPMALGMAAALRPDIVLLDIGLPGMDGYELARRIRELPELGGVQLIAVTGRGQEADRQAAEAAGFHSFITKPVDPEELARLLT